MRAYDLPAVAGAFTANDCRRTGSTIAAAQESSGAIPWFRGGHTDPWDHVECAMALTAAGFFDAARGAYDWCRSAQRSDGSWPIRIQEGVVEDAGSDTNFCAYVATGVWHYVTSTGDVAFAETMWPTVRAAVDFVLEQQHPTGEIGWAIGPDGPVADALLTGNSSMLHSLRCALALANRLDDPQPDWEVAVGSLRHAIRDHPEVFAEKQRYSMDWYYPILGGAVRGPAALTKIRQRWNDFVVPGLGVRCVADRPWVTGAETCELVLALDTLGQRTAAARQFAAMQHLRESDGSYWTGLVFDDGVRWPEERTTWTGAAVVLAADALSRRTPSSGIFRGAGLPTGLEADFECECVGSRR